MKLESIIGKTVKSVDFSKSESWKGCNDRMELTFDDGSCLILTAERDVIVDGDCSENTLEYVIGLPSNKIGTTSLVKDILSQITQSNKTMVANELRMMLDSFRNAERRNPGAGLTELEGLFRRMELNETPYSTEQSAAMREAVENFDNPYEFVYE